MFEKAHTAGRSKILSRAAAALFILVLFSGGEALGAARDPAANWRTLDTAHFSFHFPEKLSGEASKLAAIAERLHPDMTKAAGYLPDGKTDVVLADDTDDANGLATVVGRNLVIINAAKPVPFSSIADFGGWLETVFVHEYAHVLFMDRRRGYAELTGKIFGKTGVPVSLPSAVAWFVASPPNIFLPPWIQEGSAVVYETLVTGRGRGNSTWYDTIYRAAVLENAFPPLDRLGGDYPEWPYYSTRYIFGNAIMAEAVGEKGVGRMGELAGAHGGRFPYFLEAAPRQVTGKSYPELYEEAKKSLVARYAPQLEQIRKEGLTPFVKITRDGRAIGAPRWLDPGHIAFTSVTPHGPPVLMAADLADGGQKTLFERAGNYSRPMVTGPGRIAFPMETSTRPWAGPLFHNDLYEGSTDGGGNKIRRITSGLRALSADYSPELNRYAAAITGGGQRRLSLLDVNAGEATECVLLSEPDVVYDEPAISPGGRLIAFSRKVEGGRERIALFDLNDSSVALITPEGSRAFSPSFSPDGKSIAYTSDVSGVFDLYLADLATGTVKRLTRVTGGAFSPAFSPDGGKIAFTSYSAKGFDLAVMEIKDAPADLTPAPMAKSMLKPVPPKTSPPALSSREYSGVSGLLPRFWLPDLYFDNSGPVYGAFTGASDPIGTQSWFAGGFYSPGLDRYYGNFSYVNDSWYPTLGVYAWKTPLVYSDLLAGYDYWEETRGASVEVTQKFQWPQWKFSLFAGYGIERVERISRIDEDLDNRAFLARFPFEGDKNSAWAGATLDTTLMTASDFNAAPEGGRSVTAKFRVRDEALGADINTRELTGAWKEHFPLPWPERAVFTLEGRGALSTGDEIFQSVFQAGGEAGEFPIRGYPSRVLRADRLATGAAELVFPVFSPYRGIGDWPAFFKRVDIAPFFDMGKAWGDARDNKARRSMGAEVRFRALLGYYLPVSINVGFARGFDEDGLDRRYILITLGGDMPLNLNGHARGD